MGFFVRCIVLFLTQLSISTCTQHHGGTSLLDFIDVPADPIRPAIYTFIDLERSNISLDQDYILIWAEAWASAGWDPRALTETDASNHPNYQFLLDKLSFSGVPEKSWDRFLRYLSMSMLEDGGYYANAHVFPLNHAIRFFGEKGFRLPNEGKFTMHNGYPLSLLSGNKDEWNRILSAIINCDDGDDHVKRDALVLSSLNKYNPKETIIEDSFVDVEYILALNAENIADAGNFCNIIHNKKATRLVTGIHSVGFNTHHDYLKALQSSLDKCKPTMHTFFELAYNKNSEKSLLLELDEWRKAWESAGWNTVVLTLADAKRHPLYETFSLAFKNAQYDSSLYDQMCFYRWLAMASTSNGGWMSDYDTYPLHMYYNTEYSYNLPNDGSFTSYYHFVPNLLSGSKSEWNRMVNLVFSSYQNHPSQYWSDMLALNDIITHDSNAYTYTYDAVTLHSVYSIIPSNLNEIDYHILTLDEEAVNNDPFDLKKFCVMTKGKFAVHNSHASCKKVKFCHNNRGPILNKWLDTWRQKCLYDH